MTSTHDELVSEDIDTLETVFGWLRYTRDEMPKSKRRVAGLFFTLGAAASLVSVLVDELPEWLKVLFWLGALALFSSLVFIITVRPLGKKTQECLALQECNRELLEGRCSPKGFHDASAGVYGFNVERLRVQAEVFMDGSGKSHTRRTVVAITAEVQELEHYGAGGGTGGDPKKDRTFEIHAESCPFDPQILIKQRTPTALYWVVRLSPPLPKDSAISYSYTLTTPPGTFVMDGDKLAGKSPDYEWWSMDVKYPSDLLEFEIALPRELKLEYSGCHVWCDRGAIEHEAEVHRVRTEGLYKEERLADGRLALKLCVPNPILGMRYAICWRPTRKKASRLPAGITFVKDSESTGCENDSGKVVTFEDE